MFFLSPPQQRLIRSLLFILFTVNGVTLLPAKGNRWPGSFLNDYQKAHQNCSKNYATTAQTSLERYQQWTSNQTCALAKLRDSFESIQTYCSSVSMNTYQDCLKDILKKVETQDGWSIEGLTLLSSYVPLYFSNQPKSRAILRALSLSENLLVILDYLPRRKIPTEAELLNKPTHKLPKKKISTLIQEEKAFAQTTATSLLTTAKQLTTSVANLKSKTTLPDHATLKLKKLSNKIKKSEKQWITPE